MSQKKREGAVITQFLLIRIFTPLGYRKVPISQREIRRVILALKGQPNGQRERLLWLLAESFLKTPVCPLTGNRKIGLQVYAFSHNVDLVFARTRILRVAPKIGLRAAIMFNDKIPPVLVETLSAFD